LVTLKIAKALAIATTCGFLMACSAGPQQPAFIPGPVAVSDAGPCCGPITPAGQRLIVALDSLDVEHRWPKHRAVEWDTGLPSGPVEEQIHDPDTHCSTFVAAVGKRVGVYMPRPPLYSQLRLSEAQLSYFDSRSGRDAGWYKVDTAEQAQALANQGKLVIVGFMGIKTQSEHLTGHIAVVRPSERTEAQVQESGVLVSQAGSDNRRSTSARFGFRHHPGAFPSKLQYFAHDIPDATGETEQSPS
jgi:hypothetical protein